MTRQPLPRPERVVPGQTGIDVRALDAASTPDNGYLGDPNVVAEMLQVFLTRFYEVVERLKLDPKLDYEAEVNALIDPHVAILGGKPTPGYTPMIGWNTEGGVFRAIARRFGGSGDAQGMVRMAFWKLIQRMQEAEDTAAAGGNYKADVDAALEDFGFLLSGVRIMPDVGVEA